LEDDIAVEPEGKKANLRNTQQYCSENKDTKRSFEQAQQVYTAQPRGKPNQKMQRLRENKSSRDVQIYQQKSQRVKPGGKETTKTHGPLHRLNMEGAKVDRNDYRDNL